MNGRDRAAHNSLVQIGMELGATALVLFVGMYWFTIRDGKRYRKIAIRRGKAGDKTAQNEASLIGYVFASLAGMFVTGFFLANAYNGITMFIFAVACGALVGQKYSTAGLPSAPPPKPGPLRGLGRLGVRSLPNPVHAPLPHRMRR
jgi:O-antigen ligase